MAVRAKQKKSEHRNDIVDLGLTAPTGPHTIAQGNALGMGVERNIIAPSGRDTARLCVAPLGQNIKKVITATQGVALGYHVQPLRGR
jgi:hypothetical protein